MSRRARAARWLMIVSLSGVLPAFVLRCDKAAMNFQRGLYQGLGESLSELVVDQIDLTLVPDAD